MFPARLCNAGGRSVLFPPSTLHNPVHEYAFLFFQQPSELFSQGNTYEGTLSHTAHFLLSQCNVLILDNAADCIVSGGVNVSLLTHICVSLSCHHILIKPSCPFLPWFICLSSCFHLCSEPGNGCAISQSNLCVCSALWHVCAQRGGVLCGQLYARQRGCVSGFVYCRWLKCWSRLFPASAVFCGRGFACDQQQQRPTTSRLICK